MLSRIPIITGLIASLLFIGGQQAQAADRGDVAAGVAVGAIIGGVLASQRPIHVHPSGPMYAPPVYHVPRPVYHAPRAVYYHPAPVYYVPEPRHYHKHWHKHQHRHHGHGHRRHGHR